MVTLLTAAADTEPLDEPVEPGTAVVAGSPTAAVKALHRLAGSEIGIWEMTAGQARDIESDEVFVVVSGEGELATADGRRIALRPGVVVRLEAGDATTWTVTRTLRKIYFAPDEG